METHDEMGSRARSGVVAMVSHGRPLLCGLLAWLPCLCVAADAGALAGARVLYNETGTLVNIGANQVAYDAATANKSEAVGVDVNWTDGNEGDIQRGHWSFAARTFTPNDSTAPVDLWGVSEDELDQNLDFINAVRVVARRDPSKTPAASFLARIFGHESFGVSAQAIGYIGFAGTLTPGDIEQPIAICQESILLDGEYSCAIGRMINSGQQVESGETGGWTSLDQDDPCSGGTSAHEVKGLVCGDGNPGDVYLGERIATIGGEVQSAFDRLYKCWEAETGKTESWNLTLPVIACPGNNITTCEELTGAVNVNIIWITGSGEDPQYKDAPVQMDDWSYAADADNTNGQQRWTSFVDRFQLKNVDGSPAPYQKKAIYFKPDCMPHDPVGKTGGDNFGILAKIPVLVQ